MLNAEMLKREVVYDFGNEFGEFKIRNYSLESKGYLILTVNGKDEYILDHVVLNVGVKLQINCPDDWLTNLFEGIVVAYGDSFAVLDEDGKSYEFYPMYRRGCFAYAKRIE